MEDSLKDKLKASLAQQVKVQDKLRIMELAGRLDWSPRSNWVEDNGGLDPYIEKVALALIRSGMSREKAIATAINKIKKWAAGGEGVNADTVARAQKALASWEALKARARAKRLKKKAAK